MPNLTLKNIPREVHRRLRMRAVSHHRSLNSEALACLEAAVRPERLDPAAILEEARRVRARISGRLTDADLNAFKREGRP